MDNRKLEYLTNFHTIVDFSEVNQAAAEIFKDDVFMLSYENMTALQTMCIQKYGYEGRKKAIRAAYAYGLLRGIVAVKKKRLKIEL